MLWPGWLKIQCSNPSTVERSLLQSTQNGSGVHHASCLMGTQGSILEGKDANYFQAQEWQKLYVYSPIHLHGMSTYTFTSYLHTDPNYRSKLQSIQSAKYSSSKMLELKPASGDLFKFINVSETGCLHYKGSDTTRMIAYLKHLVPLSAWLTFYWNLCCHGSFKTCI